MKLRDLFPMFLIVGIVVASITLWLMLISLRNAFDEMVKVEESRSESLALADLFVQSSNDLTKFARLYAQTGDTRFLEYFQTILDIQNSAIPRPQGYDGTFWDRVMGGNLQLLKTKTEDSLLLRAKFAQLGFSKKELDLLAHAQAYSVELIAVETRAFNAVQGLYYDPSTDSYSLKGQPNLQLAQALLHEPKFFKQKASIMELMWQFKAEVNTRTAHQLETVRSDAKHLLIRTFAGGGIFLSGIVIAFGLVTHRKVLRRIAAVAGAADQVTAGNLEVRSNVQGDDEIGTLGVHIDHMISRLTDSLSQVETAKARLEEELTVGRRIQFSLLPHKFPAFPDRKELDLFAVLEPAKETAGDLYDFFMVDEHRLCFTIGDVSGKGVPAALFMAMAKTMMKSRAASDPSPASIVTHVNDVLSADNDNCMFVTLFLGILDLRDGTLLTTNAGHNPPLLKHEGKPFEWLTGQDGPIAGPIPGVTFKERKTRLAAGDELFFYTDGVTEADNEWGELFGNDQLKAILDDSPGSSVVDRVRDVMQAVKIFAGDAPQADDITMLALRYNGPALCETAVPEFHQTMPSQMAAIPTLQTAFERHVRQSERATPLIPTLNMALDEVLSNVIQYAFPNDPTEHQIEVEGEVRDEWVVLTIRDDGIPFNPMTVQPPDLSQPFHEREIGGLGIHLVKSMFDEMCYHRTVGHNVLTIKKKLAS